MSQIKSLILLFSLSLLTACGFKPLYDRDAGIIAPEFEHIKIDYIPDREGQVLRNYLIDNLTPKGKICHTDYILTIDLDKSERYLAFRRDFTPRQTQIIFTAKLNLQDLKSGKTVYTDKIRATASYTSAINAEKSSFSSVIADTSESNRALRTIAETTKIRLAGFFDRWRCPDES